jgi:hypothetical protein
MPTDFQMGPPLQVEVGSFCAREGFAQTRGAAEKETRALSWALGQSSDKVPGSSAVSPPDLRVQRPVYSVALSKFLLHRIRILPVRHTTHALETTARPPMRAR